MKMYLIIYKDKHPSVLTREIYFGHIDHLDRIKLSGALYLAGPLIEQGRLMQIIRVESLADAAKIVESDPYICSGYYQTYEGCEWVEAKKENNWLMETPRVIEMLKTLK